MLNTGKVRKLTQITLTGVIKKFLEITCAQTLILFEVILMYTKLYFSIPLKK